MSQAATDRLSTYQVIARKWRPQTFADLVGQEHISQTLVNAMATNRLPHALLFAGVRGTGKTSTARILAKSLRCPNSKDFVPCGVCADCRDISEARSLDVIEVDGASNNGVDAIRELRETVGYMPSSGKFKIYIIDEVHMLSTGAFNALLKTLEEPPPHVKFFMATTEAQKIPPTILSRCQRFDFRRIPSRQIAAQLAKICAAEDVKAEAEALWLLARNGDGSLRDSQSLLDQVITFAAGEVTLAKVIDILGLTDRALLVDALTALVERDGGKVMSVIERVFSAGYDAKNFAQDLLEEIRNALFVRLSGKDPARIVDLPDSEIENLRRIGAALSEEDLHLLFDMTLKGVNDLLRSQDPRIVLEMLLLRMAAAPRIASLAALVGGGLTAPVTAPAPASVTAPVPASVTVSAPVTAPASVTGVSGGIPGEPAKPKYTAASFTRPASDAKTAPAEAASATTSNTASSHQRAQPAAAANPSQSTHTPEESESLIDPARAADPWFRFVELVKKSNGLLGAMLENTHVMANQDGVLTIGVPRKMSFLLSKVKDGENIKRIESFIETFWNKKLTVDVKLADEKVENGTPKGLAEEREWAQKRSVENAVEQHPLVQTAQNIFKTQIKSIKSKGDGQRENL